MSIASRVISIDNPRELAVNTNEVMRYLGVKEMDEKTRALYQECLELVYDASKPKCVYTMVDVSISKNEIDFGFMNVKSERLSKNLYGCKSAYIFASTLGIEVDRIYEKYSRTDRAKAIMCSAIASALIESYCDYVNGNLVKGYSSRPRFSCGYGDFALEHQKDISSALEISKKIGIYLTDSYMMIPVKSVTAIIGIE
ncbi:MAG: Vitamin B12 dependent methionine synthase activation subunit [Clostridia bacterium]|nr:Vitamin B12 dependent methionine synthase activation subunit [Clostridia bacterium]